MDTCECCDRPGEESIYICHRCKKRICDQCAFSYYKELYTPFCMMCLVFFHMNYDRG